MPMVGLLAAGLPRWAQWSVPNLAPPGATSLKLQARLSGATWNRKLLSTLVPGNCWWALR